MEFMLITARIVVITVISVCVLFNVWCISGETFSAKAAERSNMAARVMPYRVLWYTVSRSPALCLADCARDQKCYSFSYKKPTGQCQGHSMTFGSSEGSVEIPDARYYVLTRGEYFVGDACMVTSDCVAINTECRDGMCMCIPGYSFFPKIGECRDADCTQNGTDFLEVRDHFISQTNMETYVGVSLFECFALCLNRTDYTCLTLEYGRSSGECFLANITKLDLPGSWFEDVDKDYNISYYQRDCD